MTGRAHLDADGGAYLILLVGSDRKRGDERDCGNHEQIPSGRGEIARCLNHPLLKRERRNLGPPQRVYVRDKDSDDVARLASR